MSFYPTLREEVILTMNIVVQKMDADPSYLDHPDCPYSDTTKAFFRKKVSTEAAVIDLFEGDDDLLVIDQQIQQVINDLEAFSKTLTSADHSEKLAYFKTKTTLLEKLVGMKERVFNLKELNEFRMTILAFMDETCTKDQITDLMKRLDGVLGTQKDNE